VALWVGTAAVPLAAQTGLKLPAQPSLAIPDSVKTQVERWTNGFFTVWQKAWMDSEKARRSMTGALSNAEVAEGSRAIFQMPWGERLAHLHCHPQLRSPAEKQQLQIRDGYPKVRSAISLFSICPSWRIDSDPVLGDEAEHADAAITQQFLPGVLKSRNVLLANLKTTADKYPSDGLVIGQYIRFLIESSLKDEALAAARGCRAEVWWCAALEGYVHWKRGELEPASVAYERARVAMPMPLQCEWDDLGVFLSAADVNEWRQHSCAEQLVLANRYWWLADPLWSESANERRTVHDARQTLVRLHSALPADSRYHWQAGYGADAVVATILRYGWPSYAAWSGTNSDKGHAQWMRTMDRSLSHAPFTTFEYTQGRTHTAPTWSAVKDIKLVADSTWQLNDPLDNYVERAQAVGHRASRIWWPSEHFRREWPLVQLPEGQVGLFRRHDAVLLAAALNLAAKHHQRLSATDTAFLLISSDPKQLKHVDMRPARSFSAVVLQGEIPSGTALMSLEILSGAQNGIDARTRSAFTAPPTLKSMRRGEVAISGPVLLNPPRLLSGSYDLFAVGDTILQQMMPGNTVSKTQAKVGIYWESYGFGQDDSLDVVVRIERIVNAGLLQRIGMALNIAEDPSSSVSIRSREGASQRTARTMVGGVALDRRAVLLDISRLGVGDYDVVVLVGKPGASPESARRRITVTP